MVKFSWRTFVCWLLTIAVVESSSRISVQPDGGYTGIVFKVDEDVPEEACAEILQNLQVMLTDASRVLFIALDGKLFYKEVTVVVPQTWRDSRCKTQILTPRGASAYGVPDVYVTDEHPVHRKSPYTQQSKGCGHTGDFMAIPFHFLTSWNHTWEAWGDPSKVFVHEWAKLRYGIFDEHGYADDPLYPNYYKVNGQVVPTGTSNVPISGAWMSQDGQEGCDPTMSGCHFVPSSNNQQATCSLGYFSFLPNVHRYCGKDDQWMVDQALAPTKHNVLCQAKSAQDIIMGHDDLRGRTRSPDMNSPPEVNVRVVKEPKPKYVLILESSSSMIKRNLWKWVSKAAQKFIRHDLADNSRLAIVTFSNDSVVQHPMASLTDENARARVADTIPDKYKVQRSPDQRCVICGVQTAMQSVLDGDEAGTHVILVTRGDNNTLSLTDESLILEHARYYQVKFSAILVPESARPALAFYDSLSKASGGKTFVFSTTKNNMVGAEMYHGMTQAFEDMRRLDTNYPADIPVNVYAMTATREEASLKTSGTFAIDSTLGRDTQFGIIVDDADDYFIQSVTFFDGVGVKYGPYNSLTNNFNVINLKTINFRQDSNAPPFDDPAHLGMEWEYEVQWYDGGDRQLENVITVESKARNLGSFGLITVALWTNSESSSDIVTSQHPLAMFVQVSRGNSPVIMARVTVTVSVSLDDGSVVNLDPIDLYDNGNGDPDLTAGDGIYSRYLVQYPASGRYSFIAQVDDNSARAYTIQVGRNGRAMPTKPPSPGLPVCCGSQIEVPTDLRLSTGSFRRQFSGGPVIHLIDVPENDGQDRMPPSRIGDLRLESDDSGRKLVAQWTAPGDDFDTGNVSSYKFIFSEDVSDLLDPSRQPPILHTVSRQDAAGTEAKYSFTFKRYEKDYHVGLYAMDEAGNQANISNIVLVRLPTPPSTVDPNGGGGGDGQPSTPKDTDWVMVGIVTGVVVTLLLCLLVGLYVYFFVVRRRRGGHHGSMSKSSGVNVDLQHGGAGSDNSSYDDAKNSSSNQLVPQISTISNAYKAATVPNTVVGGPNGDANGSTSFANGITPTYWSASQLLKEHEERKLRENLAKTAVGGTGKMGSIAEETNIAYDYGTEPFHQYGYYTNGTTVDGYPVQLDLYFPPQANQYGGYNIDTHRLSTTDSVGGAYPVNYQPNGGDYNPTVMSSDTFNATVEGSDTVDMLRNSGNRGSNNNIPINNSGRNKVGPTGNGTAVPPKNSGSDNSSSGTLGITNPSLQGSLLSVNSGRPPSTMSKTRNITQV